MASVSTTFAEIAFDEVSNSAGFGNSYSETWGAAWGNLDGDAFPDLFFSNHRNRATLYRNNRNGTFSEISGQVDQSATAGWTGGRANLDTHGASWGDIDNDGDDDLYQAVEASTDQLLVNTGGLLTDRTAQLGVSQLTHAATRQNLFLDFNGDGRLDLAGVAQSRPSFAPQLANGTFGHGAGVERPMACTDAQWAHLADVYPSPGLEFLCAPRKGSYPKVNAFSGGAVTNVTSAFRQYGSVIDAASLDFNGDLRQDLFLLPGTERPSDASMVSSERFEAQFITAARKSKSVTFRTSGVITISASVSSGADPQGNPAVIDIGASAWSPGALVFQLSSADARNWGIATGAPGFNVGYLIGTGEWKISQGNNNSYSYSYVQVSSTAPITGLSFAGASAADRPQVPVLLRNTSSGLAPVTGAGLGAPVRCQSVVSGDFDNDMDEDLFLACTDGTQNTPDRLYRNDGGTFTAVPNAGGAAGRVGAAVASKAGTGESVVTADYDLDGFLDLLVTNGNNMRPVYLGGPRQLFRNRGNAMNHWLQFDLVGTTSNRDGVGARMYVTAGGIRQYREQNGGYHRWSQNSSRIHVGLGPNVRADVDIVWPNGATRSYSGLIADRIYRLGQDGNVVAVAW